MLFKTSQELKYHLGFIDAGLSFANMRADLELASSAMRRQIGAEIYDAACRFYDGYRESYQNPPSEATEWQRAMSELVIRVQLPIALNAYLAFAPNNDLTHDSSKGRQIMVGQDEKPAFEWQIERDENALKNREQRATEELLRWLEENTSEVATFTYGEDITFKKNVYYQAFDQLLFSVEAFNCGLPNWEELWRLLNERRLIICHIGSVPEEWIESNNYGLWSKVKFGEKIYSSILIENAGIIPASDPGSWAETLNNPAFIPEYKNSDAWKQNNRLLVNTAEMFDEAFPIEKSYRLFAILRPFVKRVEEQSIVPIIGKETLDDLLEKRRKGTLTVNDTSLMGYIIPAVALKAMSRAVRSLSATLLPDGMLKQFASNSNATRSATDYTQRNQLAMVLDEMAATDLRSLQAEILCRSAPDTLEQETDLLNNNPENNFFRV